MRESLSACKHCFLITIELVRLLIELVKLARVVASPATLAPANSNNSPALQNDSQWQRGLKIRSSGRSQNYVVDRAKRKN